MSNTPSSVTIIMVVVGLRRGYRRWRSGSGRRRRRWSLSSDRWGKGYHFRGRSWPQQSQRGHCASVGFLTAGYYHRQ